MNLETIYNEDEKKKIDILENLTGFISENDESDGDLYNDEKNVKDRMTDNKRGNLS